MGFPGNPREPFTLSSAATSTSKSSYNKDEDEGAEEEDEEEAPSAGELVLFRGDAVELEEAGAVG